MSDKPTLAFIDKPYHKHTGSSVFLRKILSESFNVIDFWYDENITGSRVPAEDINKNDYVLFFQDMNPLPDLRKITAKIIWVPMYDTVRFDLLYWKTISLFPVKVIAFSERIEKLCLKFNIPCINVRFYFNPNDFEHIKQMQGNHLFFWARGAIKFSELKKCIRPESVDSFIYLDRPDPGYINESISQEDITNYKLQIIKEDGFWQKDIYINLLLRSNIFISPRKKEGIGMSFLEALAMGLVVIAYDGNTMNEYIEHGVNGYLFGKGTPSIKFDNLAQVRINSMKKCEDGYNEWERVIPSLVQFVKEKYIQNTNFPHNSKLKFYLTLYRTKELLVRHIPAYLKNILRKRSPGAFKTLKKAYRTLVPFK